MNGKRIITLDRLVLHLPRGADPQAVMREVSRALAAGPVHSTERLRVSVAPSRSDETPQALERRIGRATAARLNSGGGA